jgi:putative inorganic carbon (HCO3(-)) transporter
VTAAGALSSPSIYTPFNAKQPSISGLQRFFLAGYIICLPIQFPFGGVLRIAPSDAFLALCLLLGVNQLRIVKGAWGIGLAGLAIIFTSGTMVRILSDGTLSTYVLINKDIGIVLLFVTYAILTSVFSDWETARGMLRLFLYSVLANTLVAIGAYILWNRFGIDVPFANFQHARISGFLVDPNAYGGLLTVAASIHLLTWYGNAPLIKGFAGRAAGLILITGLALTFSRSSWIGFGIASAGALVFAPRVFARMAIGGMLVLIPASFLVLRANPSELLRLAERPDQIQARLHQLGAAVPLIQSHPLFGIGTGVFTDRFNVIIHNTSLWMLTEFGLVGLLAFASFFCSFIVKGTLSVHRANALDRPLLLGLLCAHCSMLGVSMGIEALYQRHWWMVMALLSAAYARTQRTEPAALAARWRSQEEPRRCPAY